MNPHSASENHAKEISVVGHGISEWWRKVTFYNTEIVKNNGLRQGILCHIFEIFSQRFPNSPVYFLKNQEAHIS